MEKLTIKQIKEKLETVVAEEDPLIDLLRKDERKGAQRLLAMWQKKQAEQLLLKEKFIYMTAYEKAVWDKGDRHIAGIDEAGRGPLAGPVVAGAVILPKDFQLLGLDDSKAISKQKRDIYFSYIKEHALAVGIGIVQADEIDEINIYEATKKAMLLAIDQLNERVDYLLVDAMKLQTEIPQQSIIKGDAHSISIAAASIIAKVTRDRLMTDIGKQYPAYSFEKNMGYGTKDHLLAIEKEGITKYHRKSFAPIAQFK